jgi:CDP-glycerol glycerophosphotransferase
VWIAKSRELAQELRSQGLASYYEKSLRGICEMLRAKYFVIDAFLQPYHFMFAGKSKIIQLLHGKGMKKKGYGEPQLKKQDYIFGTSQFVYDTLSPIFTKGSKYFNAGYPRNDVLFHNIEHADISVSLSAKDKILTARAAGKKIVLYAPTFRRGKKVYDFQSEVDVDQLSSWCMEKNVLFIANLHNKYRVAPGSEVNEHIILLPQSDIYPLFQYVDLLVTDYSSIFVDYLLIDRPIIFYPYDLDEYSQNEGLVADYDAITPGPKVFTFPDLLNSVIETLGNTTAWKEERQRVRNLYHTHTDGYSAKRIFDIVQRQENL